MTKNAEKSEQSKLLSAGGRNNVQELLRGQRQRSAVEVQRPRPGNGVEELGGGHQEPDADETAALRERRPGLFLVGFDRGTYVVC